jgi:hypothetical protein
MSSLSTLPKGDSAWLLRKAIERIIQQISVLETNIGSSTTGNSANTQIIFNDNGVLRGDAGLTYNKTTDLLSVGAATITGDLTVDTNTLFVDAANNRVGMGTLTPVARLIVRDGANRNLLVASDASHLGSAGIAIGSFTDNAADWAPLSLVAKTSIAFGLNGSTAMTLNSTGLGVGMTPASSQSRVQIYQALGTTINGALHITDNATTGFLFNNTSSGVSSIWTSGILTFSTGSNAYSTNGARMTLDASGKLILGTTSPYNAAQLTVQSAGGASGIAMAIQNDNDTYFAINFRNSAGTSCGSISCTTSATAFNLSSDYRLKESVQPLTGGLTRINALKPSIYKWKVDGKSGEGFIAHELADVVPLAVTGEKDAVNEDGSIKPQQVDFSKIVPILVAAIKELTARVEALEA